MDIGLAIVLGIVALGIILIFKVVKKLVKAIAMVIFMICALVGVLVLAAFMDYTDMEGTTSYKISYLYDSKGDIIDGFEKVHDGITDESTLGRLGFSLDSLNAGSTSQISDDILGELSTHYDSNDLEKMKGDAKRLYIISDEALSVNSDGLYDSLLAALTDDEKYFATHLKDDTITVHPESTLFKVFNYVPSFILNRILADTSGTSDVESE